MAAIEIVPGIPSDTSAASMADVLAVETLLRSLPDMDRRQMERGLIAKFGREAATRCHPRAEVPYQPIRNRTNHEDAEDVCR